MQPRPGHGTRMKIITNFKIKASTHNLWNPFNFSIKLWLLRVSKHKKIRVQILIVLIIIAILIPELIKRHPVQDSNLSRRTGKIKDFLD